jgi:hypothetical protein
MAKERSMRVTLQVSLFAAPARLLAGCFRAARRMRDPRCERASPDGEWKAALVDEESGEGASPASHILLADAQARSFDPDARLAVFEGRVERMEWSGRDLLVAFPDGGEFAVYSLHPGLRYFHSPGPPGGAPGFRWIRLSIRRCRR